MGKMDKIYEQAFYKGVQITNKFVRKSWNSVLKPNFKNLFLTFLH